MEYINLHNHTEFSNASCAFPDVMIKVEDAIDRAIELGYSGLALTDHESLQSYVRAEQYLDKLIKDNEEVSSFKLIRGNEIYIARSDMSASSYKSGDKFYHFILLALDKDGYNQLRELSNRAWNRCFFKAIQRRWNTLEDLEEIIGQNPGHVVGTTACLGGITGTYFQNGADAASIEEFIIMFENIFGKDNFFIELAPALKNSDQEKYNDFLIENYSKNHRFVISTDSHYLIKEDLDIFKVFLNSKSTKDREVEAFYSTAYMWKWEDIAANLSKYDADFIDQCRRNSVEIGNRCIDFRLNNPLKIPKVPMEDKKPTLLFNNYNYINKYLNSQYLEDRFLLYKIFENYDSLIDHTKLTDEQVYSRINQELEELWEISESLNERISSYLTTMAKMIDIIWEDADTLVGVSRGSAGAWITNYLLGITQMNPLLYPIPIYHWRFIHKTRPDMPDIDFDTPGEDKEEVIQALRNYFESIGGSVTQVAAYKTEASRSALRTAARGLGIDDETALYATSLLDAKRGFFPSLHDAYFGGEEFEQVKEFKNLMDSYPKWWAAAQKIEGLITGLSAHAAGIMVRNDKIEDKYNIMKTTKGITVTSNDLHESEYMGLIKFDCLSVDALGKIRTCMNYLLQDGLIEWQGSLKETYKKYLWPSNLVYSQEFWDNINENNINSLFQLNTQVGRQGLARVKPNKIEEAGIINTLIRLQPQNKNDPMPIEIYKQFKENINLWYEEMHNYGLTEDEIKILEKHLLKLSGVADSQESVMQLSMDPQIAGFDMIKANKLRKGIAKKSKIAQAEVKEMFYHDGLALGTRKELLDYVWNVQIGRQLGYSFSLPHVAGYTYIAMQEAELYTNYPHIYWNAAVLSSDAGSDAEEDFQDLIEKGWMKRSLSKRTETEQLRAEFMEEFEDELEPDELEDAFKEYLEEYKSEEDKKATATRRGRIAFAISNLQDQIDISAPEINTSGYGFRPDKEHDAIVCGLKIIAKCGNQLINDIIKNRPYNSLNDFISKVKISKDRVCYLIKAGVFRNIEERDTLTLLKDYVLSVSDQKKKLTLQNLQMLIKYNLLPAELSEEIKIANWVKYVRKTKYDSDYFVLDDRAYNFYTEHISEDKSLYVGSVRIAPKVQIETYYKKEMEKIKAYITKNEKELLDKLNSILFNIEWDKYGVVSESEGEINSMRIYIHRNPLKDIITGLHISTLDEVRLGEIDSMMNIKGKLIPKMKIHHIVGVVIDKDKLHNMITILTPDGAIEIKMAKEQFAFYGQTIVDVVKGEKVVKEASFFEIGTKVIATGALNGDLFKLKKYKNTPIDDVLMRIEITEDKHIIAYPKVGGRDE